MHGTSGLDLDWLNTSAPPAGKTITSRFVSVFVVMAGYVYSVDSWLELHGWCLLAPYFIGLPDFNLSQVLTYWLGPLSQTLPPLP